MSNIPPILGSSTGHCCRAVARRRRPCFGPGAQRLGRAARAPVRETSWLPSHGPGAAALGARPAPAAALAPAGPLRPLRPGSLPRAPAGRRGAVLGRGGVGAKSLTAPSLPCSLSPCF